MVDYNKVFVFFYLNLTENNTTYRNTLLRHPLKGTSGEVKGERQVFLIFSTKADQANL